MDDGVNVHLFADVLGEESCDNFSKFYQNIYNNCNGCHVPVYQFSDGEDIEIRLMVILTKNCEI